ncbi:MAG: hypothetical protein IPN15_16510 [Saprospiraceae bacterium]|nr:hypothetical protein [Candidatus Vicinibacter affinis]
MVDGLPTIRGLTYTYGISTLPGSMVENIWVVKGANSDKAMRTWSDKLLYFLVKVEQLSLLPAIFWSIVLMRNI